MVLTENVFFYPSTTMGKSESFESWLHVGDKLQTPFLLTFLLKEFIYLLCTV